MSCIRGSRFTRQSIPTPPLSALHTLPTEHFTMSRENVLLFGLGGIGGIYACILHLSGLCDVSVVARSNYDAVSQKGFRLKSPKFGDHDSLKFAGGEQMIQQYARPADRKCTARVRRPPHPARSSLTVSRSKAKIYSEADTLQSCVRTRLCLTRSRRCRTTFGQSSRLVSRLSYCFKTV